MLNKDINSTNNINFKCIGDNFEEIPVAILERSNLSFPRAHTNKDDIALLSKELQEEREDYMCKIPFCLTVEADALGAKIKLGDNISGPRVSEYSYKTMEEICNLGEIDLTKGRIKEVLDSVKILSKEGQVVCLKVEGPFTIVSSLINPNTFYKEIRKNRECVDKALNKIKDFILKYAIEGIKRGANIISYGDPVGSIDIVGPKIYRDISGKISHEILKELEPYLHKSIVSICGKMSTELNTMGCIESRAIEFNQSIKYGQGIIHILENKNGVKFIGHNCIKNTNKPLNKSIVWEIKLR